MKVFSFSLWLNNWHQSQWNQLRFDETRTQNILVLAILVENLFLQINRLKKTQKTHFRMAKFNQKHK